MRSLLLGVGCAAAASTLYSLEIVLQAAEARTIPPRLGFRPSMLLRLARRPRWLAANALGAVGWPLQAAALLFAPLTVVQPALGLGLIPLALLGARSLNEQVRPRQVLAIVAILAGVAGVAWAGPSETGRDAGPGPLAAALGLLGAAALLPYAVAPLRRTAAFAAWGAGCAFAWSGVATKLVSDAFHAGRPVATVLWLVGVVGAAAVGILSEMSAVQRRAAAPVAAVVFAAGTLVPVALAPALFGETWPGGGRGAVLVVSLLVVVVGAIVLEASPALAGVRASASRPDSEVADSPASPRSSSS